MDFSSEGVVLGELSVVLAFVAALASFRFSVRACFCSFLSFDFDNFTESALFS
jgi:hypothetical protein